MNDKYLNDLLDKYSGKDKWKDVIYDPFDRYEDEDKSDKDHYMDFIREYLDSSSKPEPPKKTEEEIRMEKRKQKIDELLS